MKKIIIACVVAGGATSAIGGFGATPPAAKPAADSVATPAAAPQAQTYNTTETPIGDLLDNPKTRAILDKYAPGFSTTDQIDAARTMTLKSVQQYAPDMFTDETLAKIDADLAKVSAEKP